MGRRTAGEIKPPGMDLPASQAQKEGMKALTLLHSIPALCLAATAEPMVRIRLIDEVNLNIEIRKSFPTEAERILLKAGVSSTWLWCPLKPSPDEPAAECLRELSGQDLVFRILPRRMIGNDRALGSSVAGPEGGTYGLVFYPTVVHAAKVNGVPVAQLVAWATVHEIGHLLLGARAHWPRGIMHPRWEKGQIDELLKTGPFFNRFQSNQMQEKLAARVRR
jgi:hypothetical protein